MLGWPTVGVGDDVTPLDTDDEARCESPVTLGLGEVDGVHDLDSESGP